MSDYAPHPGIQQAAARGLIFAFSDPDWRVVAEARDGLQFISRKLEGYGPPANATPEQKQAAQAKWKRWYLSIRPDAELLD